MNTTWRYKSCPRCGGDLHLEEDEDNWQYEACLQCAYRREVSAVLVTRAVESPGPTVNPKKRRYPQ